MIHQLIISKLVFCHQVLQHCKSLPDYLRKNDTLTDTSPSWYSVVRYCNNVSHHQIISGRHDTSTDVPPHTAAGILLSGIATKQVTVKLLEEAMMIH